MEHYTKRVYLPKWRFFLWFARTNFCSSRWLKFLAILCSSCIIFKWKMFPKKNWCKQYTIQAAHLPHSCSQLLLKKKIHAPGFLMVRPLLYKGTEQQNKSLSLPYTTKHSFVKTVMRFSTTDVINYYFFESKDVVLKKWKIAHHRRPSKWCSFRWPIRTNLMNWIAVHLAILFLCTLFCLRNRLLYFV